MQTDYFPFPPAVAVSKRAFLLLCCREHFSSCWNMNLPLLKLRTTFSHDKVIIKTEIGSITSWKEREFFKRQIMHGNTSIVLSLRSLYCLTPCEQRTHNWNCKTNPKLGRPLGVSQRCALGMVPRELSNRSELPALSRATGMAPQGSGASRAPQPPRTSDSLLGRAGDLLVGCACEF